MQLVSLKEIKGVITLRSGLHIGAGDMEMRIGGTDNPVIKHPHTQEPYIPGSSIKGKVRSLLEMRSGLMMSTEGKPLSLKALRKVQKEGDEKGAEECLRILKLFGVSGADDQETLPLGPTRVSFADCPLHPEWRKGAVSDARRTLIEVKSENSINRIKGTAENPRFTERVPAGVQFEFSVTLKQLEPEEDLLDLLMEGLKLLELDALGGSGSRGYGRIVFQFEDPDIQSRFDLLDPLGGEG